MGEILKNAYKKAEEVKTSNEYRFLAQMYTEVYAEKESLKSKVRNLLEENLKLSNELWKLRGKNEKNTNNLDSENNLYVDLEELRRNFKIKRNTNQKPKTEKPVTSNGSEYI